HPGINQKHQVFAVMAAPSAEPHESWDELLLAGPSTLSKDNAPAPYPCRAFADLLEQSPFGQSRASDQPDSAEELRCLRVLSLHFSDPMTLMRSVATAGRLGYASVHWQINCECPELMARNLLLLCVARTADGPEHWRFFWSVFFNKYILTEHKIRLKTLLNNLAEGGANGGRADPLLAGVNAPEPVLNKLRSIWKSWLGGLKSRSNSLPGWGSQAVSEEDHLANNESTRAAVDWLSARKLWAREEVVKSVYRYLVAPKLLDHQLNYDSSAFNVWANPLVAAFWPAVERDSLLPFDLFAPYDAASAGLSATPAASRSVRSLTEFCFDRAADLVAEFAAACRSNSPSLTIGVGLGNDLLAASRHRAARRRYHLVDAGNLADSCPVCGILTACQPLLLASQSVLMTITSRWLGHYPSAPAYVTAAVGRLPELLYGLRLYKPTESELLASGRISDRPQLLLRWAPHVTNICKDAEADSCRDAQVASMLDNLLPHCIGPPAYGRLAYGCYPVAEARLSPRTLHRLLRNHGLHYFELDLSSRLPALARALLSTRQGEQFDPHYLQFSVLCRPQPLACLTLDLRRPGTLTNLDELCAPGAQLVAIVFESRIDVPTFLSAYNDKISEAPDTVATDACALLQRRLAGRVRAFERAFHVLSLVPVGAGGTSVARVFLPPDTADQFGPCCCLLMEPGRCVLGQTRNNRVLLWSSLVAGRLADFCPATGPHWPGATRQLMFKELPLQTAACQSKSPVLFGVRLCVSRPPAAAATQLSALLGQSAYPAVFDRLAAKATISASCPGGGGGFASPELEAADHWAAFVAQLLALYWSDVGHVFLRDLSFPHKRVGLRLRLLDAGYRSGGRPLLLVQRESAAAPSSASVTVKCPLALMSELEAALTQCQVCPDVSYLLLPLRMPVWPRRARQLRQLELMQDRIGRRDCAPCQV
ncbi:hypothetical protein BOX15_Mlig029875g2, partial [Macrostomum lignano]